MKITIRPAQSGDVDQVVPLMYSAGPDAFRYVFSIKYRDEVLAFLRLAYLNGEGEFGYCHHWVACIGDQVVGLAGYRKAQDNVEYMKEALRCIFNFYGVIQGIKVSYRGLLFERIVKPPKKGVICLHNLAVSPDVRGQGIGQKMIEHMVNYARAHNFSTVGLDVAETNPSAKALYTRLGFRVNAFNRGDLHNRFGRGVSHEYMEYNTQINSV